MSAVDYVRAKMKPLTPIQVECERLLIKFCDIRSVVFDIYGTLMISAAGDISLTNEVQSVSGMQEAFRILGGSEDRAKAEVAVQQYQIEIKRSQEEKRKRGVDFPEVEIREVWAALAEKFSLPGNDIEAAALAYECAANPCWEMPGAKTTIDLLQEKGLVLGIISNAQFYTPHVVEGTTGVVLRGGIIPEEMIIFSYEEGEGKPSRRLFEKLAVAAKKQGIQPEEILYVGNDFVKDIEPAQEVGFRAALFAGDARSLRTGSASLSEACATADVVLTELAQLREVLGL